MSLDRPVFTPEGPPRLFFCVPESDAHIEIALPPVQDHPGYTPATYLLQFLQGLPEGSSIWLPPDGPKEEQPISHFDGRLIIDEAAHEIRVNGELVHFPLKQHLSLVCFGKNFDQAISFKALAFQVWGRDRAETVSRPSISMLVKNLRKGLGPDLGSHLTNVRGLGYKLGSEPDPVLRASLEAAHREKMAKAERAGR